MSTVYMRTKGKEKKKTKKTHLEPLSSKFRKAQTNRFRNWNRTVLNLVLNTGDLLYSNHTSGNNSIVTFSLVI